MRIHQITHLFEPDKLAGASLYTDLAQFLRDRGHDVRVTTTFSYYPKLQFSDSDAKLRWSIESFKGIPVKRIGMVLPKSHAGISRLIPELSFLYRLARHGEFPDWTPDVVVTACPMMAQVLAMRLLYAGKRVPKVIVVQDLMVDAAFELGILRHRGLMAVLRSMEKAAFRSASQVITISDGMADKIRTLQLSRRDPIVIPNWIHRSLADEIAASPAPVRSGNSLFYSGNLGVKQGFPGFLRSFSQVGRDWQLDINGGGAEASRVLNLIVKEPNIRVGPVLPESDYLDKMRRVTACVVTQQANVSSVFMPSKVLPALATGTPILGLCDPKSPLGIEITKGRFGVVVNPESRDALESALNHWRDNPQQLSEMSENARTWGLRYGREAILERYESVLESAAAERPSRRSSSGRT